jgi:hypothetical protein
MIVTRTIGRDIDVIAYDGSNVILVVASQTRDVVIVINRGLSDAARDGKTYGRKDGEWVEITGGSTITIDDTVTETSENPVKSSGIWTFVQQVWDFLSGLLTFWKEPTGFFEPENVIITANFAARTIALTGTVAARWRGVVIPALVSGWVSPPHTDTPTGDLFLYYDGTDFVWSETVWEFDQLMIAIAVYEPNLGQIIFYQRECHGVMPADCHRSDHFNTGTWKLSGGDVTEVTLDSTTARRPAVAASLIYDEDCPTIIPLLRSTSLKMRMSLTGAAISTFEQTTADIIYAVGNQIYYNSYDSVTDTWGQTALDNNRYVAVFLAAVPVTADSTSQNHRYLFVQGQAQGTLAQIRAYSPSDLNLGTFADFAPEFVFIHKFILRFISNNWSVTEHYDITGSRALQVTSPAGNWLTAVTTDVTLKNNGTVALPLGLNLNAIPSVNGHVPVWNETNQRYENENIHDYTCSVVNDYTVPAGGLATIIFEATDAGDAYNFKRLELILTSTTAFAPTGSSLRLSVNGIANNNYLYSTTTQSYYAITATHVGGGLGIYSEVVAAPQTMSFMARSTRNSTGTTIASATIYGYILPQAIDTSSITKFAIATGGGDDIPEGTRIIIKALK